jgi:hypothetical protein
MQIEVATELYAGTAAELELPIKSWDEIKQWYVKWDCFHYTLDGEKWHEIDMCDVDIDVVDWKRPSSVSIRNVDTAERLDGLNDE